MAKLNVLFISYLFPPFGGTGVMRAASLARYFPAEDIRLDVLTPRNPAAVGTDSSLLQDIPSDVTVHRTLTLDLPFGVKKSIKRFVTGQRSNGSGSGASKKKSSGLIKSILDNILLPDPQVTWYPVLRRAAPRIIRDRNIDLVLITVPPFSNLLIAKRLRKLFPQMPIVLDFRDEWISTSFEHVSFSFSRSPRAHRLAIETERDAVACATAVVAVTEGTVELMRSRQPTQPAAKFHLVPNGYDATRLARSGEPATSRIDGKVLLTHVGTVYSTTAPAGLIDAINLLPAEIRSRLKLRFIGHIEEPRFRAALEGLGDMVQLYGYVPQREALRMMNETDYVLLVHHDPLNIGSKLYDYMGGGKPVLAAIRPDSDTRRLIERTRAGWWAPADDVDALRQLLADAVERGDSLREEFRPDAALIAQYERRPLAQRYAALLRSIAGKQLRKTEDPSAAPAMEDAGKC